MTPVIPLLFLSAFPAALLIAAMNDIYEFKIPNWVSVVLFCSFFAASLGLGASSAQMLEGFILACVALVIGFSLFAVRILGGGDAKLLAATAPWIGLGGIAGFLFNVALAGAGLAIVLMLFRRVPAMPFYAQAPWLLRLHQRPKDIPYAVAIAIGGLLSFSQTPNFQLAFGG
ncbi:MAG: prepilin peptidase [Parvularculaceae bacterium]|nr:prepilin peptidase [Parvularculaceae bacterium]